MNNIYNKEKRWMKTKYISLIQKQYIQSELVYMISEYIDNSIESWNDLKKEIEKKDKFIKTLNIDIHMNIDKNTISIEDNAAGMSPKTLEDSIELEKITEGDGLNKFGVGMKNATFWLGQDLEIWTNNGSYSSYTSVKISENNPSNDISWIVKETNEIPNRGTRVLVSNIYAGKMSNIKKIDALIIILARKFNNYIVDEKVSIKLCLTLNGETTSYDIEGKDIESQIIPEQEISSFEKIVSELFDKNKPKILLNVDQKIISLARDKKPIKFEYWIDIDDNKFLFTFGVQTVTSSYFANYGLGTLQANRYINIPGVNAIKIGEYTRGNIKRGWGKVDFKGVLKVDNNKKLFFFGDLELPWEQALKKIGDDMETICSAVALVTKNKDRKIKNNKLASSVILNKKTNHNDDYKWTNNIDGELILEIGTWKVVIKELSTDKNNDDYFFIQPYISQVIEKTIIIEYNINHPIITPFVNKKSQIVPLVSSLGVSMLISKSESNELEDLVQKIDSKNTNFFEIFNKLISKLADN